MHLPIAILIFLRPFNSAAINPYLDMVLDILFFVVCSISIIINQKARKTQYDRLISFFILSLIISCIFSQDPLNSVAQLYKYVSSIFIFYFFLLENNPKKFIIVAIASGLALSLYSLFQYFFITRFALCYLLGQPQIDMFSVEFFLKGRAFCPFVSPNLLAGYLVMIISLSAAVILMKLKERKNDLDLFLSSISLVVMLFTLFLTKSVGAWTAFFIASSFCFILRKKFTKRTVISFIVIFVLFLLIVIMRFSSSKDFNGLVFSINNRLIYWKDSFQVIAKHFLTGVGLGNFVVTGSIYAHNSYIQFFSETGSLGIISLLGIVLMFFKNGIKKIREHGDYLSAGIFVSGAAFLIQNFVDFSFFITQVSFLWWMAFGLILSEEK